MTVDPFSETSMSQSDPRWRQRPRPRLRNGWSPDLVPVLESLQVLPVTLFEHRGVRLYVDVVDATRAIGMASDGVEQRGTDNVADLETDMVFAVPEGRQLNEALVALRCRAELLRENGVGNADILGFVSAVSDADAGTIGLGQIMFEIGTDSLYRRRVHRRRFEWQSNALYPDTCNQFDVMMLQ